MSATIADGRRIDAHLHLWDLDVSDYAWLGPEHGELHASFTVDQARSELDAAGIDFAVLVQAEDSAIDTAFLLQTANDNPWILGVVGWVPLDDPRAAEEALERWGEHPAFCGVRQLVHDDPRDGVLSIPEVRRTLGLIAARGLPFDVPDAWPRHLDAVADLAAALPELTIVVDHLAKPPIGGVDYAGWSLSLARVAEHPNTVAKVSGQHSAGTAYSAGALRPVWDTALEAFGPGRLIYGGDWPMSVPSGGYQATWAPIAELIAELAPGEQRLVLAETAAATYRLERGCG